jgi:hypothetical protein
VKNIYKFKIYGQQRSENVRSGTICGYFLNYFTYNRNMALYEHHSWGSQWSWMFYLIGLPFKYINVTLNNEYFVDVQKKITLLAIYVYSVYGSQKSRKNLETI